MPESRDLPQLMLLREAVIESKKAYMAMAEAGADSPRPLGQQAEYVQALERAVMIAAGYLRHLGIETMAPKGRR